MCIRDSARTRPKTISVVPMIRRSRNWVSIVVWNSLPRTAIGSVPTITNQPIRAFGSRRSSGVHSERIQVETIAVMSLRK